MNTSVTTQQTPKPRVRWDKPSVMEVAATFRHKRDFMNYAKGAYDHASKHGFLPEATAHMVPPVYEAIVWDDDSAMAEAAKNEYISVFKRRSPSAYHYLRKRGLLAEATKHMSKKFSLDVVYMWNSKENPNVWKIGVSTQVYHTRRLTRVLKRSKLTIDQSVKVVTKDARNLEKQLLKIGTPFYTETKFNGSTEFRVLTDEECDMCFDTMKKHGVLIYG